MPLSPPRRPDVAILLHNLRCGGAERVCMTLAQAFDAEGLAVDFVLRQAIGELLEETPAGAAVVDLGAPRVRHALPPLVRYLKTHRPRSMLAALWPLTSIAIWARTLSGVGCRVVTADHCILTQTRPGRSAPLRLAMSAAMRASYWAADDVVAVSSGVADDVAALAGLSRSRVRVFNNPITPLPAAGSIDPANLGAWLGGSGPRLVSVANLKPVKDQETLIRALVHVRHRLDARLLILGEGPDRSRLESLIRRLGLGDAVTLAGFRAAPQGYVAMADVFVLTSRAEGFGNVLVEALACGVPVVSTDCPTGPREILDNGRHGALTPVGDPEALAAAIIQTLDSPPDPEVLVRRSLDFPIARAVDAYRSALLSPERGSRPAS